MESLTLSEPIPWPEKNKAVFPLAMRIFAKEHRGLLLLTKKNSQAALSAVEKIMALLGAHAQYMDAKTHDERAAMISHMPYVISKALLDFVTKEGPESLKMAGPGFKSTTCLGCDNPILHTEIGFYNRLLSKFHSIGKMVLFGVFFDKFFDHMYAYALKIYQKNCTKITNFSNQSEFRKKSNKKNIHKALRKFIDFLERVE